MKEIYFDRISNISVQGPITSIDLARAVSDGKKKEVQFEKRITITLTTQNLMNFISTLNQTGLALKKQHDEAREHSEKEKNSKVIKKK